MYNFLLRSFVDFITNPIGISAVICCMLGIALICSAKNITRAVRKTSEIKANDRVFILSAFFGVLLLCVGVFLMFLINDFTL